MFNLNFNIFINDDVFTKSLEFNNVTNSDEEVHNTNENVIDGIDFEKLMELLNTAPVKSTEKKEESADARRRRLLLEEIIERYSANDVEKESDENDTDLEDETEKNNVSETGTVLSVKDGVVKASGLLNVKAGEMVKFTGTDIYGMALNLEVNSVGIVVFGNDYEIKNGAKVERTSELMSVPVGEAMLGRVVDALGNPIDNAGALVCQKKLRIERKSPGILTRKSVHEPLQTGIKAIDALLPIGRGQRELIIGDRQTGKTTIAIDTILNQARTNEDEIDMYCIYVAIGQKRSTILNVVETLKKHDALRYTVLLLHSFRKCSSAILGPLPGALWRAFRDDGKSALIFMTI